MQNSMVAPMAIANALLNGMAALRGTSALERYNDLMKEWASIKADAEAALR